MLRFQSTLPRGERRDDVFEAVERKNISIHAPARGATDQPEQLGERIRYFNPRSREGSDGCISSSSRDSRKFQSTLPRGERQLSEIKSACVDADFNPRSREGSDYNRRQWRRDYENFNPRSREGSDLTRLGEKPENKEISIHAPARGATFC